MANNFTKQLLIPLLISVSTTFGQKSEAELEHAFSGTTVFSILGGAALGQTDYKKSTPGFIGLGKIEYFFATGSANLFSLGVYGIFSNISGTDERTSISTKDGVREIPPKYKTSIYQLGAAVSYSVAVSKTFFPYASIGFSNLWFDPKDGEGNLLEGNETGLYEKSSKAYDFELGFKILVSSQLSINLAGIQHIVLTDYLDDIAASGSNDSYLSFLAGISYSPFLDLDKDGDGIENKYDACPESAEDFDGFQDDDGCPESDNDADGIPDELDKCPNKAEDFDGFQDDDGCPELDNDLDGIPDANDLCINAAEDIDGYQDSDGCPDPDNDLDGIPDSLDNCPDEMETVNGINDDDGCPDTLTVSELPSKFVLSADKVFFEGTAKIKFEAKNQLDEIVNVIKQNPGTHWRIEGHLDSRGSERYIRNLSLERAKAILEYFAVFGGLDRADFDIYGMGDKFPIGNNKTEEGRRKNRRVEIKLE